MQFVLISSEPHFKHEEVLLNQMFQQGLSCFHLRKPTCSLAEQEAFLHHINPLYHNRIVLHDHYELTQKFDLKGIHYNARNRTVFDRFLHENLDVSGSFHCFDDVEQCVYPLAYAFLGPIFDSISKHAYKSAFKKEKLIPFLQSHKNIVALGGVNSNNIDICHQLGFKGVAVLGAVWCSDRPLESFKKLKELCQNYDNLF